ncbi:hypothetical protein ES703_21911 [subsurface metagenome]
MTKIEIKVENGETVVTIDGTVVTAIKHFTVTCPGDNNGDDKIELAFLGTVQGTNISRIVSEKGEVELTIPDALGEFLKGA